MHPKSIDKAIQEATLLRALAIAQDPSLIKDMVL